MWNSNGDVISRNFKMMWRTAILNSNGDVISRNFKTKEACEEFVLSMAVDINKSIILNKETKEKFIVDWTK